MDHLINLKHSIAQELNQNDNLQRNLLISILSSRRLLSDHLDILEEAVNDCTKGHDCAKEKLTLIKTTGMMVGSYAAFACIQSSYRYLIPCISSAVPLLYICKQNKIRQRSGLEGTLKSLIKSFDEFESGVKKTLSFLNDAQVMEVYAKVLQRYDRKNQIPFHLVDTIKRVIRAVYCFTKYLEYYYKLDSKLSYLYPEIDDIDNCELMRVYKDDWDVKTIREFFSLFAYVQSYALLRLGLIVACNIEDGKHLLKMKVGDMTGKISKQTERIPSFLKISDNLQRLHDDVQDKLKFEATKGITKELRLISADAVDLSVSALSFAINVHELQNVIEELAKSGSKAKGTDDLLNRLESIGTQAFGCSDDLGRLTIAVKKYLKKEDEKIPEGKLTEAATPKEVIKVVKEDDEQPQKDDFFYDDRAATAKEEIEEEPKTEDVEDDAQVRLTKKCFKPVLLQLKQRIVPIGADFKEREKKVLKKKGIEIPEEEDDFKKSCSESGSDEEVERGRKIIQSRSKFNEHREFLESKMQFSIFGAIPAAKPMPILGKVNGLKEDILE